MRVIITGGTGLIGRALCVDLVPEGHDVIVLSRNPESVQNMPSGVRLEQWDARTTHGWGALVDGADAIINLAGAGIADARWSSKRKEAILNSRVNAGKAIIGAIEQAEQKPRVLLQASAVGYYGAQSGDREITEESAPGNDYLAQVCFDWETSTSAADKMDIRRPILRTGIVLSNDGGAWPRIKLPFTVFAGGPLGRGEQWYPWIHITDEVRAIRFLLENSDAAGPFNLSAPTPVTNKALAAAVGNVMGRPAFMPAPAPALKIALGEMSTIVLDGQRAVPKHLLDLGFTYIYPDIEAAVKALLS